MATVVSRRLFTVDEFARMVADGIVREEERVELLEGEITPMSPIGSKHAACVKHINVLFTGLLGGRALLGIQDPVQLDEYTQPQPDVAVLQPRSDFYAGGHPQPKDILLIIEVADTSVENDRSRKLPLYATAGVPEVWIIDLVGAIVESHRQPSPQGYRLIQRYAAGDSIAPAAFPDARVDVAAILR